MDEKKAIELYERYGKLVIQIAEIISDTARWDYVISDRRDPLKETMLTGYSELEDICQKLEIKFPFSGQEGN